MKGFNIIYVLFILVSTSLFAQDFKEYKTKTKESLKKIAAKFDVDYDELKALNPELKKKAKKNTVVKIPVKTPVVKEPRDLQPIDFRPEHKTDLVTVPPKKEEQGTHKVLPKETLYGVSKQYGISMSTLIKMNPILAQEGLKIGQELNVPVIQQKETPAPKVAYKTVIIKKEHAVQAGETLYGLSRMYSVTVESIKKENPELSVQGLKNGTTIIIPIQKKIRIQKTTYSPIGVQNQVLNINTNKHVVAQEETLYSIAGQYGISISEILRVNSNLIVDDMGVGTVLNIPVKLEEEDFLKSDISPIFKNQPITYAYQPHRDNIENVVRDRNISMDSLQAINPALDSILFYGGDILLGFEKKFYLFDESQKMKDLVITDKPLSVVLMLPFEFKKNDSLSVNRLFSRTNNLPNTVTDFYLGAKIAIDSLRKQGIKISLNVIDTEKSVDKLHAKMDDIKSLHPDMIIGPLFSNNAMYVATHFPKTPVYYPVYSKKQSGFTNFNLIKTATSKDIFRNEMMSFIKERRKDEHLILVGGQGSLSRLKEYKKDLSKSDSLGALLENDISILTLSEKGFFKQEDIIDKVKPNKTNWVLIADNYNPITDGIFSVVNAMSRDEELNAKFRILSFDKLSFVDKLSYLELAKQKYTYATDEVEYESLLNSGFVASYKEQNNAYPGKYAIKGFAVAYDAVLRVLSDKQYDVSGASQRLNHAFYYHKNGFPTNGNQAVFINMVENTEENGLRVVRLK